MSTTIRPNRQEAPFPLALAELVNQLHYAYNWQVTLRDMDRGQGSSGLTLVVLIRERDTYNPENPRPVRHLFSVPPAAFDRRSWMKWLFDQLYLVWLHEHMEAFLLQVGEHLERPFAPHHGPGNDPYTVFIHGTDEDVRTSPSGKVKSREDHEAATKVSG